jgi:hypothetical protein
MRRSHNCSLCRDTSYSSNSEITITPEMQSCQDFCEQRELSEKCTCEQKTKKIMKEIGERLDRIIELLEEVKKHDSKE